MHTLGLEFGSAAQLSKRGVYSIHIKKLDGGHLSFCRWPKINIVHSLGGMTSLTKFEVDWLSGSKDIAFTRCVYSIHIKNSDGGHLCFRTWHKINTLLIFGGLISYFKIEVDW